MTKNQYIQQTAAKSLQGMLGHGVHLSDNTFEMVAEDAVEYATVLANTLENKGFKFAPEEKSLWSK